MGRKPSKSAEEIEVYFLNLGAAISLQHSQISTYTSYQECPLLPMDKHPHRSLHLPHHLSNLLKYLKYLPDRLQCSATFC